MPVPDAFAMLHARAVGTVNALYGSEDQKEGARAFAEKRKPVCKGR